MAADIVLTASTERETGTRPSRRLRQTGRIPAVVYGRGSEPTAISVPWKELRAALTTDAGLNVLITLDVDGQRRPTLVKDIQRHPIRRDVLHVDFLVVDTSKPVHVDVPLVLGEAPDLGDVVIEVLRHSLPVEARPDNIPNEIHVDLSAHTADTPIRVGDLPLPEGVTATVDDDETVVAASASSAAVADAAEAAEAAAGGAEDGGAAGAEAPADGGADGDASDEG